MKDTGHRSALVRACGGSDTADPIHPSCKSREWIQTGASAIPEFCSRWRDISTGSWSTHIPITSQHIGPDRNPSGRWVGERAARFIGGPSLSPRRFTGFHSRRVSMGNKPHIPLSVQIVIYMFLHPSLIFKPPAVCSSIMPFPSEYLLSGEWSALRLLVTVFHFPIWAIPHAR